MRPPGVSYYRRVAAARGPSRLALKLKEDEIIKACFQQSPGCRKPRDSASDYNDAGSLPAVVAGRDGGAVAQTMTEGVRRPDYLSWGKRRPLARAARGERNRRAEHRREHLAPCEIVTAHLGFAGRRVMTTTSLPPNAVSATVTPTNSKPLLPASVSSFCIVPVL